MSKFHVGDSVRVRRFPGDKSLMTLGMTREFGGKVTTVCRIDGYDKKNACNVYNLSIDPEYYFNDFDLELVERVKQPPQRIEIPIPGGHLAAETVDYGGDYPGIHVFFVASGESVEHSLCFAEVRQTEDPDVIRVGTYYADCDEVKDVVEYPIDILREA